MPIYETSAENSGHLIQRRHVLDKNRESEAGLVQLPEDKKSLFESVREKGAGYIKALAFALLFGSATEIHAQTPIPESPKNSAHRIEQMKHVDQQSIDTLWQEIVTAVRMQAHKNAIVRLESLSEKRTYTEDEQVTLSQKGSIPDTVGTVLEHIYIASESHSLKYEENNEKSDSYRNMYCGSTEILSDVAPSDIEGKDSSYTAQAVGATPQQAVIEALHMLNERTCITVHTETFLKESEKSVSAQESHHQLSFAELTEINGMNPFKKVRVISVEKNGDVFEAIVEGTVAVDNTQ